MNAVTIYFPDTEHLPVTLTPGTNLSQALTVINSPLLFGCRTGICGTCLIQIESGADQLAPPDKDECEALEVYAPANPKARLACRIVLTHDIALKKIQSA